MFSIRRFSALPLLALIAAGAHAAAPATSTPATAAASTAPSATSTASAAPVVPLVKPDLSSPAATAKTLLTALNKADFTTVHLCLDIPPVNAADIDVLLGTMQATAAVQQAAAARFLNAGEKAFGNPTPAQLEAQLKAVAKAEVTLTGTTATLTLLADPANAIPGGTVQLKQSASDWKIDGPAFFKLGAEPADKTAARVALARQITAISHDMAKEISDGKFFSAADAYQEYWSRCKLAAAPATKPAATASMPASAPK